MVQDEYIDDLVNAFGEIYQTDKSLVISTMHEDLLASYKKNESLSLGEREVWASYIIRRLRKMLDLKTMGTSFDKQRPTLWRLYNHWKSQTLMTVPTLHFGQMRISSKTQSANVYQTVYQQGLANQNINEITAKELENGLVWEIHIFQHAGTWISANNRGLAVHCRNKIAPLRVFPRTATTDETNRLAEVEGQGAVGNLTYTKDMPDAGRLAAHRAKAKRDLPSTEIPVTDGPNSWIITEVISTPTQWSA